MAPDRGDRENGMKTPAWLALALVVIVSPWPGTATGDEVPDGTVIKRERD